MSITRRELIRLISCAGSAVALSKLGVAEALTSPSSGGPFEPTRESLKSYQIPQWFRDAKFGIWAHWGPQSAIEAGDWYARNMYIQDSEQYKYHVAHYGHPSKVGYKDLVGNWHASKFDPDHLMSLYKKAGAKYFVSMGVHHDNFDLWNSKHTRWNAVNMGPKKDIVGLWREAARKQGLKFGVSEHLWISYKWFALSHSSDKTGPLAGIPYDGIDPKYADLYYSYSDRDAAKFIANLDWNDDDVPESFRRHYLDRMTDLIDNYQPDFLYTDGHLPFEKYGLEMVSHLYNVSARLHGTCQAVYTSKEQSDCTLGTCVQDHERGVADGILPKPWQTDTCIGDWHYNRGKQYKTAKKIVDLLVDIVSKNGNLLLNFPLPNSGELDSEELKVLDGITTWMATNSEGIYSTRPWKIYGVGPSTEAKMGESRFNEDKRGDFTAEDVRFTTKGKDIYAFVMGWPEGSALIKPLAINSPQQPGKIQKVEMLGYKGPLRWKQDASGLRVEMPERKVSDIGFTLKVRAV